VATSKKKAPAKGAAKPKPKDKPKPKSTGKPHGKAPMSTSSAGATARIGIKKYVRFRPGHQWAQPLASPEDRKTLGEWDAWYKAILASRAK
jgi:hypothetical protein